MPVVQCAKQDGTGIKTDTDQQNRGESSEINPHECGQMIINKSAKAKKWGKDSLFNKWCRENWISKCKRMKLDCYLSA